MMKLKYFIWVITISAFFLAGCGQSKGRSADELMPEIPGYTVLDAENLTAGLQALNLTGIVSAAYPNVAAIDALVSCIQKSGVLSGRIYSKTDEPMAAGIIFIVNQNRLFSLDTILSCARNETETVSDFVFDPCLKLWSYNEADVTYHMFYAATTGEVCQAFCDNMLGCPGSGG